MASYLPSIRRAKPCNPLPVTRMRTQILQRLVALLLAPPSPLRLSILLTVRMLMLGTQFLEKVRLVYFRANPDR